VSQHHPEMAGTTRPVPLPHKTSRAAAAAGSLGPLRTRAKLLYYRLFAALYRLQGAFFEV